MFNVSEEMTNLLIFTVLIWTAGLTEGITTHSVTGCSNRVHLSCPIFEKIHVERITYYNGTDCNQTLTDQQVCGQPLTGSDTGLLTSCAGKKSCSEILYYTCPGSKAARVDYRCVPDNKVEDMCDDTVIENINRIFLSTPNYPLPPTFTNISPCRCYIRASNITSIEILELILNTTDDGTKSSLEINYGDVPYRTESLNGTIRRVYNKRLTSTSTTAEIILNRNNINKHYLWIEIQGVSMNVSCNNETESSSSSPSTVISTSSPSTVISTASPSTVISTSSSPSSTISTSSSPSSTTPTSSSPSSTILTSSSSSSTISTSSTTTASSSPMTSQTASDETNTTEEPPFTSPASTPTPTTDSSSKTTHPPQTNIPEEPPFTSPASTPTPTTDSSSKITDPPTPTTDSSSKITDPPKPTTDSSSRTTDPPTPTTDSTKIQDYTSVIAGSVVGGVILIVIIIIIFICRKRSKNRSPITKPDTEKISMDNQRIYRGHPDGGEIDDDLTKVDDDDVDLNEVIESDNSGQTASNSNKDVVYAEVNKPGRKPMDSESNSVAPNFTLGDNGSHYAAVDGDLVKDSIGQAMSEETPADETVYAVVNKSDKSLGGESNSVAPNSTSEEDGSHYADIDDVVKDNTRQPQGTDFVLSEDTPGTDYSVVNKFKGFSQNNDGWTGSIDQDTDHYTSIDINDSPKLQNTKNSISNDDDKVSSDKTQESDGTRSKEDSSDDPVYSVVNKAKNKRNSLEADDKSPERIITENELYVPFDDEVSDRIVMENDLYVPMEDTLITTAL